MHLGLLLKVTHSPCQYYWPQEIKKKHDGESNGTKFIPGFVKIQQFVCFLKTYKLTNSTASQNILKKEMCIYIYTHTHTHTHIYCVCVCEGTHMKLVPQQLKKVKFFL